MSVIFRSHFRPEDWQERFIGGLLLVELAVAPWAFGGTQTWAIMALNMTGSLLGLTWLLGKLLSPRNTVVANASRHWSIQLLELGTIFILVYSLVAAVNAQSTFDIASMAFQPLPHWSWLPHSYDRRASWLACWQNFALAGTFWAVRDWLLTSPKKQLIDHPALHTGLLPTRARRLIFFLVTNGLLLSVVALLQRLDNTGKLLWLVQPKINTEAWKQFGPFAYRSNGLQYLALVWPLGLGLWSMLTHARRDPALPASGQCRWLMACVLVMIACPLLWESRMAVAVDLLALTMAVMVLLHSHRGMKPRLLWGGGMIFAFGLGLVLNWDRLTERFLQVGLQSNERLILFQAGGEMFRENWFFGTGPGTFRSLYHLYRPGENSHWQVYMHSDWLETLTTYGVAGFILVAMTFAALFFAPFNRHQWPARNAFIILAAIGLGSCLLHATLDFPFQIYSIQHLFVVLAALYSTSSRQA